MKKQKNVTNAKKSGKGLTIEAKQGESEEQAIARTMLSPALQSAWTLKEYVKAPVEIDLGALIYCLEKQKDLIRDGNLERIEQMLLSQAHTLDAIANNLFRRSRNQEYMNQLESYMKLGLRAQSQCRATLETLASIKNPKAFLNQTNIAHNQQINNGRERQNPPNELLEKTDGERLDGGTPQEAVGVHTDLATVGEQHRAKDN